MQSPVSKNIWMPGNPNLEAFMTKKRVLCFAACVMAALMIIMVVACEQVTLEPTGNLRAVGGPPGGSQGGAGFGQPDPSYTGRRFNSDVLPSVATWNQLGHQHAYPDPFHFANGNVVVTVEDWENRRKEISKIVQYYEYGVMPSYDEDTLEITWLDTGVANSTITVTHKASGRTASWTQNTTLPAQFATSQYEGKASLPLALMGTTSTTWTIGGTGSFSTGTFGSEADGSGLVHTLYGINTSDPSAPSGNTDYAWGMSILLTVLEGIDGHVNGQPGGTKDGIIQPSERGFRGYYNPNWVAIDGYSRGGKASMAISAFAEGRRGSKVGYVSVGSAGSGGPALERFLSPAGYQINGQFADPMPLDGPGLMQFEGLVGKPWYMKKINNGDPMIGTDGQVWETTPGGSADTWRYRAVRGWSPYFETYDQSPTNYSSAVTTPFIGWQSPAEMWSGIQSLSEGRNETPGWFSVRFREFADLHYGLDIDHVRGNEGRSKYGVLCTIPFDQHYLGALIAPRGLIMQDGYVVPRNNPESQFAHWVIADEVYKLYGEAEGDPEKYIWNNGFGMTWGTHGSNTGNEGADKSYQFQKIIEGVWAANGVGAHGISGETDVTVREGNYSKYFGSKLTNAAKTDSNLMKLRTPWFQVDDPVSRFDYYRMTWGRPGHPTIAERVKARVEPILPDYVAGEASRPFPTAFAPATHPSYTPIGPKFKAMDWRGLIDQPEPLE
jgi:hypothetical protein